MVSTPPNQLTPCPRLGVALASGSTHKNLHLFLQHMWNLVLPPATREASA